MLQNLFSKCGLNSTEQELLIALLQRGAASAAELAKLTSIKRPTVYAALDGLYDRGLVVKERLRTRTVFRPMSSSSIPKLLERQAKSDYDRVREATHLLAEQLLEIPTKDRFSIGGFKLSTIESSKAVYAHLEEVLNLGDFSAVFDPQLIPKEQLKTTVKGFLENTSITQPAIREIAVSGPATDWYRKNIRNRNHILKEIPKNNLVLSDMILVGGEVVISNYQVNSELAVRIREPNLYRTLMTMFDLVWRSLPESRTR